MARRIGLAQALINDPEVVLLDEPTAGLDPMGCRQVKELIRTLAHRGKTVLLSSHLLADVEDVCDRIMILYNGRIQAAGRIRDLLKDRSRHCLTVPELPPKTLRQILAAVRELTGSPPQVEHPRKNLEAFFLEVVRSANSKTESITSGISQSSNALAGYLKAETENNVPPAPLQDRLTDTVNDGTPVADARADELLRRYIQKAPAEESPEK
jgi:ABC-2 type transport system ATP-binding protein